MRLSSVEITQYLSTKLTNRKRVMLHNINDILKVNELLTNDDISDLRHNTQLYDALHDSDTPFEDVLDDFFMNHLNEDFNSNDVMCWLQEIYS